MAAMTEEDIIKQCFKNISDYKATILAKISVVFYGILAVGFTYFFANVKGIISQISTSFTSSISGPMTGLFLYSMFYPWATKKSAIIGTVISVAMVCWLSLGQSLSTSLRVASPLPSGPVDRCYTNISNIFSIDELNLTDSLYVYNMTMTTPVSVANNSPKGLDIYYSISYLWIGALGQFFTIFFAIIASLIEGIPSSQSIDVRYVLPFFDHLFPCIPKHIRKKLYLGVPFEKRQILLEKHGKSNETKGEELLTDQKDCQQEHSAPNNSLLSQKKDRGNEYQLEDRC